MNKKRPSITRLINNLYRITQSHIDERLKKFNLSSGTYPFLVALHEVEGISQNEISRRLNVDKAMTTRAIKKLLELGYVEKEGNEEDSRAYKLYLTEKAKDIIPEMICEIAAWMNKITSTLGEENKEILMNLLEEVLDNAKEHKLNAEEEDDIYGEKSSGHV